MSQNSLDVMTYEQFKNQFAQKKPFAQAANDYTLEKPAETRTRNPGLNINRSRSFETMDPESIQKKTWNNTEPNEIKTWQKRNKSLEMQRDRKKNMSNMGGNLMNIVATQARMLQTLDTQNLALVNEPYQAYQSQESYRSIAHSDAKKEPYGRYALNMHRGDPSAYSLQDSQPSIRQAEETPVSKSSFHRRAISVQPFNVNQIRSG